MVCWKEKQSQWRFMNFTNLQCHSGQVALGQSWSKGMQHCVHKSMPPVLYPVLCWPCPHPSAVTAHWHTLAPPCQAESYQTQGFWQAVFFWLSRQPHCGYTASQWAHLVNKFVPILVFLTHSALDKHWIIKQCKTWKVCNLNKLLVTARKNRDS